MKLYPESSLWSELARWPWPVVAFESPQRLPRTLLSLAAAPPERPLAVCRELTKRFEEVVRGRAADVAERFRDAPKGEVTVVIGAARERAPGDGEGADEDAALDAVGDLVGAGASRRDAARVVSRLTGISANRLYRRSL